MVPTASQCAGQGRAKRAVGKPWGAHWHAVLNDRWAKGICMDELPTVVDKLSDEGFRPTIGDRYLLIVIESTTNGDFSSPL